MFYFRFLNSIVPSFSVTYSNPFSISLFASLMFVAVLLCLEQNLGLTIVVGVPCFWGAFAGFDKIFRVKET